MNTPILSRRSSGFTLIEMIGVLAIVAILAAVMAPRVFSTIANSRVTGAVSSVNAVSSAVTDFVGKYGPVPLASGNSRVDDLLLTSGYLDSRFIVKIGTQAPNPPIAGAAWTYANSVWTAAGGSSQNTQSRVICSTATTTVPTTATGSSLRAERSDRRRHAFRHRSRTGRQRRQGRLRRPEWPGPDDRLHLHRPAVGQRARRGALP
jgi:prepilin-type N-terminal cleavage/methylation domain-containing protein